MTKEIYDLEPKVFRERLNAIMESRGCVNLRVAEDTNISAPTISKYRSSGTIIPDMSCVYKLAQYLNVSIDWLVGKENDDGIISKEAMEIALLYLASSPEDKHIIHAVLDKYKSALDKGEKTHTEAPDGESK